MILVGDARSSLWALWVACLLGGAATARIAPCQEARPTFVRVVGANAQPLESAAVTFVGGVPHLAPELQDGHVQRVVTGPRGQAVARLRPGLCYVAWAVAEDRDGMRATSAVEGYVAAGAMLELRCVDVVPVRTAIVHGLDAWRHVGPLRCFAWTSLPGTCRELELDDGGRFAIPAGPFDVFEVRLVSGEALWHGAMASDLHVPPPQHIRVVAVDERGAPLAGAEVQHRVGRLSSWRLDGLRSVGEDRMRRLGVTDEAGRCEIEIPYEGDPLRGGRDDLLLFVAADGRPAVAGGIWRRSRYVSDRKVARFDGDELRFTCRRLEPLRGRLPGVPPGSVAHLAAVCKLFLQRDSYLHDARVFTAEVAADGSFAFDDLPAELHSCRLTFVPPEGTDWLAPILPPEPRRQLPAELDPKVPASAPLAFSHVDLEVQDANGGPARGAVAFLSSGDREGVLMRDSLVRVPLDERGAARLRLVRGLWVLVVVTDRGFGGRGLEVGAMSEAVRLQLQPLARATVVLQDRSGDPVAGARVRARGTTTRGTRDPLRSILQGLRRATRVQWGRLLTDADGRVEIPYVPVDGVRQRVELRWSEGRSEEFELRADAPLTVIERESARGR